jgi:hypothetical protein
MRSEKERYSDHVAVLARLLGIAFESLPAEPRARTLATSRHLHRNEHEAALALAYERVHGLLDDDLEHARILLARAELVRRQWQREGLIGNGDLQALEREAAAALRQAAD